MKNKKVILILGVVFITVLLGGSFIYSKFIDKPKIEVNVTETSTVDEVKPENKTDESNKNKEEETEEEKQEDEKESQESEIVDESYTQPPLEEYQEREGAAGDMGNGVIQSTYVKSEDTGSTQTYIGVTGGGKDEYFEDFEQFNYFLGLVGEEVPTEKNISSQGSVHTAYYDGMYVTYNSEKDKMIVVKGAKSDAEVQEDGSR